MCPYYYNKDKVIFAPIFITLFLESYNLCKYSLTGGDSGVVMGELLVSKSGIGYLIMYGSQIFNIDLVVTGVVILGIISYLLYMIIEKIEVKNKEKFS